MAVSPPVMPKKMAIALPRSRSWKESMTIDKGGREHQGGAEALHGAEDDDPRLGGVARRREAVHDRRDGEDRPRRATTIFLWPTMSERRPPKAKRAASESR